jgi:chromosome partitioning protein
VLLVDLDPQAHLTLHVGVNPASVDQSTYDLLVRDDVTIGQVVTAVGDRLELLPAEVSLAGAETELVPRMMTGQAQRILRRKLDTVADRYDFILIDCPPSLGLLTVNALVAAREVIVPMQAHFLALQGLSKLLETVSLVHQSFNPDVRVTGIVLCMYEGQTLLAGEVVADLRRFLDSAAAEDVPWRHARVFMPAVRRNIKLAEAPSFGKTIFDYAPGCAGAEDYRALADGLLDQHGG